MRRTRSASMLCWALIFCAMSLVPAKAQAIHKHALLIGAHLYEHPGDDTFSDLNTVSDVTAIKQVLIQHFQFTDSDIKVLTTKQETTRESILFWIRKFLIEPTQPGDIVYFHYSGHGSYVDDPNDPSGVDQTLVPSDWVKDGSKDIRDKEVSALLKELKAKHPGNVTLTFDCCHSGTITRGSRALVRGVSYEKRYGHPMPAPKLIVPTLAAVTKPKDTNTPRFLGNTDTKDPGYVVISACRDTQSAMETETDGETHEAMGRLSYLLTTALKTAGPQTTYEDLFERIDSMMRENYADNSQNPQIEGDRNKVILGSLALPPVQYNRIKLDTQGHLIMDVGSLQGMTKGSVFALYLAGTKEFTETNKVAEGTITRVTPIESYLDLTKTIKTDMKLYDLSAARAIETQHSYGDTHIRIDPHDFDGLPQQKEILDRLTSMNAVTTELAPGERPDIRFLHADKPELIRAEGGSMVATFNPSADLPREIEQALKREITWEFAKSLNNQVTDSPLQIEIRLIPATVTGDETLGIQYSGDKPLSRGAKTYADGDYVTIEVRNLGKIDTHVALLDLSSDGSVAQIWPDPNQDISDNIIKRGAPEQWHKLWDPNNPTQPALIALGKPYGTEIFKAVATVEKVDFSRLAMTNRGAEPTPLGQLLHAGMIGQRASVVVTPSTWSTSTATIEVQPSATNPEKTGQ